MLIKQKKLFSLALGALFFFTGANVGAQTPPTLLSEPKHLSTFQLFQVSGNTDQDLVVFIDKTGRLYSSKLDGSDKKYLSGVKPAEGEENEDQRLNVLARKESEFLILQAGDTKHVYFQAKENRLTNKYNLYRVDIGGATPAEAVFKIVRPFTMLKASPDQKKIYLAGYKHYLFDIESKEASEIEVRPIGAAPFKISDNFNYVVYVKQTQGAEGQRVELHAHDVVNKTDHTLLQKLDSYNFSFEISPDSAWVAVQRMQAGKQTLDIVSIDGAEFYPIYPQPGITQPHAFEFIKFLPAAEGDSGSLLFSAQALDSPKIFIASLADFMTVREVKTGEVVGEKLGAFQVTANGQSLVYQIKLTSNSDSNRGRTYSLNLANLEATPVFLFESEFTSSKLMADSSAIIYVSSGGFYAKNSILLTTLNGASTSPLSVNFPADWIKAEETIQRLESAGSYVLFTTNTPNSFPLEYKLHSFKR